ncbi:MAG: M23 family metallopeptidase [FCB group bacterium]|nr:M23 family metallopeptidase [FCB group bacterium]
MKKKNYTFLVVTDKDVSHSFSFSKTWFLPGLIFVIAVVVLTIIGFNRVLSHDELVNEVSDLRIFKRDALAVISDLNGMDLLENSPDYETTLKRRIAGIDTLFPITAPVEGYVTQGFDLTPKTYHSGIDIAAKVGDLVRAPADGLVVFSGYLPEMGNMIILSHDNGFFTVYGHNDTNLVRQRELVFYQQPIAKVGGSGITEGPHLHFEIWKNNHLIDPRKLIDEYKRKDVSLH